MSLSAKAINSEVGLYREVYLLGCSAKDASQLRVLDRWILRVPEPFLTARGRECQSVSLAVKLRFHCSKATDADWNPWRTLVAPNVVPLSQE
jgi:hypothetical protein